MKLSLLFLFVSFISFSQEPDTLHFYFDVDAHSAFTLSAEDQKRLNNLYNQTRIVAIEAHCDFRGSKEYNLKLAERRLKRVEKHLLDEGFSTERSKNRALGESQAESSGLSLEKCRRVDVLFIEPAIKEEDTVGETTIESINEVSEGDAPPPVETAQFSKSAVERFLEDDSKAALQLDMTILFVNVSTRVLDESKPQMFELLEIMQNNPSLHAKIHGHVCCAPNFDLSVGRARSVAIFLREYGITADRLDFEGHSNMLPKAWPEVTDDDRKQNRRVSVEFTKMEE